MNTSSNIHANVTDGITGPDNMQIIGDNTFMAGVTMTL